MLAICGRTSLNIGFEGTHSNAVHKSEAVTTECDLIVVVQSGKKPGSTATVHNVA